MKSTIFIIAGLLATTTLAASNPEKELADTAFYYNESGIRMIESYGILKSVGLDVETKVLSSGTNPEQYDSLLNMWHDQRQRSAFDDFYSTFIDIDADQYISSNIPDSVYEARLKMIMSPIPMAYNSIVKNYIVRYTTRSKSLMEKIMGRSQYYFPMIEEALDRHGLPIELRVLPIVESALSPTAVSRAGATGLWQFMYGTGKNYGLEVSSFIDERRDPAAATEAACLFLKDLYDIYGDWTLALAAYNCGPGNVNKAIKRAGGNTKNFWELYPYLPKETRGYIPSFIAATYAYTFHRQHNIIPDACPLPIVTDTLMVNRPMHIEQISSTINIPVEVIRNLNPQYKMDIIPAVNGKTYSLKLPASDVSAYLENERNILEKDEVYLAQYLKPSNINPQKKEFSLDSYTYKVKSGDTLSGIASKNGVKVSQLIQWNNLKNAHQLRIGQKLEIYR